MHKSLIAAGFVSVALLLAGCGAPVAAPTQTQTVPTTLLTLPISAGTDAAALEARTGGKLLIFKPQAGFAVLSLSSRQQGLRAQAAQGGTLEANAKVFHVSGRTLWADGRTLWADGRTLWADGRTLWADGRTLWADGRTLWADGQFGSMPQNTGLLKQVHLDSAQFASTQLGAGVTVAVIDTGLDLTQPAFDGAIDTQNMHDFVDGDSQPQEVGQIGEDTYGHGTAVAGVVRQVAPNAYIMPLRVIDAQNDGDVANVATAIVWAVDHGAKVVNLSLGSAEDSPAVNAALDYAASHGVVAALAAGNTGTEGLDYPAASLTTGTARSGSSVSVGSVNASDVKSGFSNYAGNLKLTAPGEGIATPAPEGYIVTATGTSFSTPLAAGAFALALSDHPNTANLAALLKSSAQNVDNLSGNSAFASKLGGRLDINAFLNRVTSP